MEGLRPLINAHQAATHQRLQGRRRQVAAAQIGQRQLAAMSRQFGQNRLLLRGQLGQAAFGRAHGKAFHATSVAPGGGGLARNPLFAHHSRQHRQRSRRGRAQRGNLHRLARGQPFQYAALHVLGFFRKPRAALAEERTPLARIAVETRGQQVAAAIGQPVVNAAAYLGRKRQHGAQHLAQRRQIILRDPIGQFEQIFAQQRLLVEHSLQVAQFHIDRSLDAGSRHHADQLLVAEGRNDARPALGRLVQPHAVGKGMVERHRQSDFAK